MEASGAQGAADQGPALVQLWPLPRPKRLEVQGYVDVRSTTFVKGWLRNCADPLERLRFEVILAGDEPGRILAEGVADGFDPFLVELGVGDGAYAFRVEFSPHLSPADRDRLQVRAQRLPDKPLDLAPDLQGYVDERSTRHVAGWVRNRHRAEEKYAVEAVLTGLDGEHILAQGRADLFNPILERQSLGDGYSGFRLVFPFSLTEKERDRTVVRLSGKPEPIDLAPNLAAAFEPISHLAMDITNNCNLRCPFCVYDYEGVRKTNLMSKTTFDAAVKLIPFVTDGNFWLSCLHEATMHPDLIELIESIPREWRRKVMYTTNLARPTPLVFFRRLAESGIHHLNISLESFDPELYQRMRQGARWSVFEKNLEAIVAAFGETADAPKLRYNVMAYKSNLAELPGLTAALLQTFRGSQVELRHTFPEPHISKAFREKEFLTPKDWEWLAHEMSGFAENKVLMMPPPALEGILPRSAAPAKPSGGASYPLQLRIEWDGKLVVYDEWTGEDGVPAHDTLLVANVNLMRDPASMFAML